MRLVSRASTPSSVWISTCPRTRKLPRRLVPLEARVKLRRRRPKLGPEGSPVPLEARVMSDPRNLGRIAQSGPPAQGARSKGGFTSTCRVCFDIGVARRGKYGQCPWRHVQEGRNQCPWGARTTDPLLGHAGPRLLLPQPPVPFAARAMGGKRRVVRQRRQSGINTAAAPTPPQRASVMLG